MVATANPHKLEEYEALLCELPVRLLSLHEVGIADLPEESAESFDANALEKARYCSLHTNIPSLADDSGLEVDALGGEPGVRSNRWAGPGRTDADRIRLLLARLEAVPECERTARFVCVVAVVVPGGDERTFRGELDGQLAVEPRGTHGFGYDPIMHVPELGRTVAELSAEEKNAISHRARAVRAAMPWLRSALTPNPSPTGRGEESLAR